MDIRLLALLAFVLAGATLSCSNGSSDDTVAEATATSVTTATIAADDASRSPGPSPSAAAAAPVEQWRFALPNDYYVRVAANNELVVASAAPEYPEFHADERFLVALERDSGAVRWRTELPCAPLYPAVDAVRAYLTCNDGTLRAWKLGDGSEAWTVDTGGAPMVAIPSGDLLLVADGDPDEAYDLEAVDPSRLPDGRVRAYEAATGARRWELPPHAFSTFLTLDGGMLYAATTDPRGAREVLAIEPDTGRVRWRVDTGPASSRPFVSGDAVFVASNNGLYRLSAIDGSEIWRTQVPGGGMFEAPVAIGGVVVAGTNAHVIYAISATDGTITSELQFCDCPYDVAPLDGRVLMAGPALALVDPAALTPGWSYAGSGGGITLPAFADGWFFAPARTESVAFRYR